MKNSSAKKIAPSILSADFARLAEEVKKVDDCGADFIHVDVMDGHFVPNITIGPVVVSSLKNVTKTPLDVHLMITNPEDYIAEFAKAGAAIITVHQEACTHLHRTIGAIRELGCKAGVSINPATPVESLQEILEFVDLVLVMTVNPGFGGQKFISSCIPKIEKLAELRKNHGYSYLIEVDGGLNKDTIAPVSKAGADVFVAGSAIFNHKSGVKAAFDELRKLL